MNCTVCGQVSEPHDRFCSHCGASLSPDVEDTGIIPLIEQDAINQDALTVEGVGSLPSATAQLVVRSGPLEGVRFTLPANRQETIGIGRAADNDIFLDDVTVSRKHARFEFDGAIWSIYDLGSLNGTYVNPRRVDSATLANQDEVQIGKYRFVFLSGEAG